VWEKFKDKLKLQNAMNLKKHKERNFMFISDGSLTTVN
jgi:hypothetical protein